MDEIKKPIRVWDILKWQFKRYTIPAIMVGILIYLGYTSYFEIHWFDSKKFLAQVVFEAIVMGFLGSLFFLAFLFSLKPNIKIADKICYNPKKEMYYFKMVNMSLLFPIKDVKIDITHCDLVETIGDGDNVLQQEIHIKNDTLTYIPSILGGIKNNLYAFIVQSNGETIIKNGSKPDTKNDEREKEEDDVEKDKADDNKEDQKSLNIENILDKDHNYIELSVFASHSLSGFSVQKTQKYRNRKHFGTGEYNTGVNIDILTTNG